jgi:hypothetical protein
MTKKLDPDRPNKARRGRPPKKGTNSKVLKAIWQIPWKRAYIIEKMKASRAIQQIERDANPDKFKRTGTPNGMTRAQAAPLWATARLKADRFIQKMTDEGIVSAVIVPDSDEEKGVAALHAAAVLALGPTDKQLKLAAIRTVLEYTRSKPESKSKMTINTSEQWLAEIAAEE